MDIRFTPNNTHLNNAELFAETDPHLQHLYAETYVYRSYIIDELPRDIPCIVTLGGGGRQVAGTRHCRPAGGRCFDHARYRVGQHQRAHDHARRKGQRHDP